jgi:hypothetical protein
MPGAQCTRKPRARWVVEVCARVFTAESTGNIRHSPRNGFTAYSALSPGTGLSCPRHSAGDRASLPGWAPRVYHETRHQRRGVRTTRLHRPQQRRSSRTPADRSRKIALRFPLRTRHRHVHRIPPYVRDDRDTPLVARRDARLLPHNSEKKNLVFAGGLNDHNLHDLTSENRFSAHATLAGRRHPTGRLVFDSPDEAEQVFD